MGIALCDGPRRGLELGCELARFAFAHRQESELCFQGLGEDVVLLGNDGNVVADLRQDARRCQDIDVGVGEDPQRRMAQDGGQ